MVLTNCFLPIALYLVHREREKERERERRQMPWWALVDKSLFTTRLL
jgi:hypothetical protein